MNSCSNPMDKKGKTMKFANNIDPNFDIGYLKKSGNHNINFKNGHFLLSLPKLVNDFTDYLLTVMVENRLTKKKASDLINLHHFVDYSNQLEREGKIKKATEFFYAPEKNLQTLYFALIKEICENIGKKFFVERYPTFRFHFPVPGHPSFLTDDNRSLWVHNDTMIGHPAESINCWVALTDCKNTNFLSISNLDGSLEILVEFCSRLNLNEEEFFISRFKFKDLMETDKSFYELVHRHCRPKSFKKGDIILFDSRCLHGPIDNIENSTRVSIDFRFMGYNDFENANNYDNPTIKKQFLSRGVCFNPIDAFTL